MFPVEVFFRHCSPGLNSSPLRLLRTSGLPLWDQPLVKRHDILSGCSADQSLPFRGYQPVWCLGKSHFPHMALAATGHHFQK